MLLVGLVESEKLQYRSCVYKIMPLIPVMQTAKQKRDFFDPNRLNVRTDPVVYEPCSVDWWHYGIAGKNRNRFRICWWGDADGSDWDWELCDRQRRQQ